MIFFFHIDIYIGFIIVILIQKINNFNNYNKEYISLSTAITKNIIRI